MKRKRAGDGPGNAYFIEWLAENRGKFNCRPVLRGKGGTVNGGRYLGIIPEIGFTVRENNIDVHVSYRGVSWDILRDFDALPAEDGKGRYYCELCRKGKRKFYGTARELYRRHSFDDFLEWSDGNIRPENFLVLSRTGRTGGSTMARIVSPEDLHRQFSTENLAAILSLGEWKGGG